MIWFSIIGIAFIWGLIVVVIYQQVKDYRNRTKHL